MRRFFALLIVVSLTMTMLSTVAYADNETVNTNAKTDFVYTDKTLLSDADNGVVLTSLDQYEPNDDPDNPYRIGEISAKSRPLINVNASLNNTDDMYDIYRVAARTNSQHYFEIVSELVFFLGGLTSDDKVVMEVTSADNSITYAEGVIDGSISSAAYVSIPLTIGETANLSFNIYLMNANTSDPEVNYTLQVASRYVYDTCTLTTNPSTLNNPGYTNYSSSAYIRIRESEAPASAIVDRIFINGKYTNSAGKLYICDIKIKKDDLQELNLVGSPVAEITKIASRKFYLVGEWDISYRPHYDYSSTFSNITVTFDYHYDVLEG